MEAHEFGIEHSERILLIPGNMMSWRQFEDVIPLLSDKYHVIAISTDGYDIVRQIKRCSNRQINRGRIAA